MKKNKYLAIPMFAIVLVLGLWLIDRHHQANSDIGRLNTAYSELLSERKGIQQAALSCQEYTLRRNSDFPAILKGKSIEQIKALILQQAGLC